MSTYASRRAVAYLRLSEQGDASTSIARQRRDVEELAAREGWELVAEFVDDGFTGRKQRANALAALGMLREDEADVLIVWKFDRWSRQGLRAVADLVETLDARPDALFVAIQDGLRSSSPAWRIIASVLAEVARMESDNTSTRTKSSQAHLLKVRRFIGKRVPFGYRPSDNPDGPGRVLVLDPFEADLLRELADRFLAGASLTELVRDLDRREVPTAQSEARRARQAGEPIDGLDRGEWALASLRMLLRGETLLGRTTHVVDGKRVPLADEHGLPVTLWEPVLDVATFTAIRDRLEVKPGKVGPKRTRAALLLSGVLFCECGSKAYVGRTEHAPFYKCSARNSVMATCPAPRLMAAKAEDYVVGEWLKVVGDWPEVVEELVVDRPEDDASLADIELALQEATLALMHDGADGPALLARITHLKERRRELADRPAASRLVRRETGRTMAEAWHATPADTPEGLRARRDLLLVGLDHVELLLPINGVKHALRPVEERLRLRWRAPRPVELTRA